MLHRIKFVGLIALCLAGCTGTPEQSSSALVSSEGVASSLSSITSSAPSSANVASTGALSSIASSAVSSEIVSSSSASSMPPAVTTLTLEDDAAATCSIDGIPENIHTGFSGASYANSDNSPGKGITWHLVTENAVTVSLAVRYASGSVNARDGQLVINGVVRRTLPFPTTNEWTNWQSVSTDVQLGYGSNTVQLLANTGEGLANIDTLTVTGLGVTVGNCGIANISVAGAVHATNSAVAFSAVPFTKGESNISAYDWDFGDGANASGKNVSHAYAAEGDFTATLTVTDTQGNQSASQQNIKITKSLGSVTIYIAGDSTVSNYADTSSPRDQAGWGQMIHEQFNNQVTIQNRAIGGRSARRFIDDGALDKIWQDIKAGDYLLVQFGTNDGHKTATYTLANGQVIPYYLEPATDFKFYLQKYIDGAKSRNANIIFVTPPPRNSAYCTGGNGTGAWAEAMRELGADKGVPVADLNAKVVQYLKVDLCPAPTPETIFFLRADGSVDGTHFQENGARVLSKFVAEGIREANVPLSIHLK